MSDLEEKKKAHIDNIIEQHKDNKTIQESELMNSLDKLELDADEMEDVYKLLEDNNIKSGIGQQKDQRQAAAENNERSQH